MTPDRRPQLGPPPPAGGAALAVRTAVRRRRARRWAAAGTASLAALAVGAVVTVTGGGTAALDTERRDLDTAFEPTAEPGSTPTPEPTSTASAVPAATPTSTSSASTPAEGSPEEPAGEESGAPPTTAADPSYRTPDMRRTGSRRPGADAPGAGPVVCGGSVSGNQEDVDGQVGWCVDLALEDTREGHAVSLRICRDDSSDGALTFATSRETEMVVRRGDAVVWRWSEDHPERDEPHALPASTGDCWTWSLDYTDVDSSGRDLPAGSYEVTVATTAAELDAGGTQSAGFTIA